MDSFSLVIFGFTSNLAQLKIIPALYDLEEKNLLNVDTKIFGIGRKEIDIANFVGEILHTENRQHLHPVNPKIQSKLIKRIIYFQENFEEKDGPLYKKLGKIQGNILYYLATYPNLYAKIFQSLSDFGLNKQKDKWVRIMIEKPIGNDSSSAKKLDDLLTEYFDEGQIFRVDHYLGKEALRKVFGSEIERRGATRIDISILENFGIGRRGVYYDATGALIDMGQNHLLQMLAAVVGKSEKREDRAEVLENLKPESNNIFFGQYEGYLNEENVNPVSVTDTFFALKTELKEGKWSGVPIYLLSGKKLDRNEAKIVIYYRDGTEKVFSISPLKSLEKFDPYERLILDCIAGDQTYFNSPREIEASWKFVDELSVKFDSLFIYKPGSNLVEVNYFD